MSSPLTEAFAGELTKLLRIEELKGEVEFTKDALARAARIICAFLYSRQFPADVEGLEAHARSFLMDVSEGTFVSICEDCQGKGFVVSTRVYAFGRNYYEECPACSAKGWRDDTPEKVCVHCGEKERERLDRLGPFYYCLDIPSCRQAAERLSEPD